MMTSQDAKKLIERIIGYSTLPECEVRVEAKEIDSIRFANNGITTSGYQITQQVSITSITDDRRSGNTVVSEVSDEALRRGVEQAEQLAGISRPDPEYVAPLGPQPYRALNNFDAFTAQARSDVLIPHVKIIFDAAHAKHLIAAGFVSRTATASAVANKAGLFGYTTCTEFTLTNTMRNKEGSSSGWATQASTSLKDIDGSAIARVSSEKCVAGVAKQKLDPGKYTVILEPAAVSDLMSYLGLSIDARSAEQGQSFLSRKGKKGETLAGEKLFPEYISLRSDPLNPKLPATPWDDSLLPNDRTAWIEKGVMKNMYWDRFWAGKAGRKPTPSPSSLVLDGQSNTLDDLIKSADRALLVTRFFYVRYLQPQTLQLTGLTRDGVFLVKDGKIVAPVTNFRWNESPVRVLQNTKKLSRPVLVSGSESAPSFAPAILATDFNFASISDAV